MLLAGWYSPFRTNNADNPEAMFHSLQSGVWCIVLTFVLTYLSSIEIPYEISG